MITAGVMAGLSSKQVYATAPNPSWWVDNTGAFSQYDDYQYKNGRTHQGTFYAGTGTVDSSSLGASYDGVTAVGPRYADVGQHVYVYFTSDAGASQEDEWQCTELVKRFLYLEYGVNSLSGTSGDQVVANYASTYSTIFKSINNQDGSNSTNHVWPKAGDVLSYSDVHTAIITNVNITDATNGNATLTLLEQNASSTGTTTQQFVGWKIKGDIDDPSDTRSDTVTAWLTTKNFVKTYGTSSYNDYIVSQVKTSDGGSIALGYGGASTLFWVGKLDAGGNLTWQKYYLAGSPKSIIQTSDGYYLVGGYYYTGTHYTAVLLKLDSSGNVTWYNKYDLSSSAKINAVAEASNGDYVAAGSLVGDQEAWVMDVDKSSGNINWQKTLGNCNGNGAVAYAVLPVSDGTIVTGQTGCNSNGQRGWIFKLNSTQGLAWQKILNTGSNLNNVVQLASGSFIANGTDFGTNGGWLVKFDGSGSISSERSISIRSGGLGIYATPDGGYAVNGSYWPTTGNYDIWLGKFDSSDNLTWQKGYGGTNEDDAHSIQGTNDGGYVIGGQTQSYGLGSVDGWVIKTDSNGNPSSSNNSCSIVGSPSATTTSLTTSLLTSSASYASSSVSPSSASVTPTTASWSSTAQCTN